MEDEKIKSLKMAIRNLSHNLKGYKQEISDLADEINQIQSDIVFLEKELHFKQSQRYAITNTIENIEKNIEKNKEMLLALDPTVSQFIELLSNSFTSENVLNTMSKLGNQFSEMNETFANKVPCEVATLLKYNEEVHCKITSAIENYYKNNGDLI